MRIISPFEAEVLQELSSIGEAFLPDYDEDFNQAIRMLKTDKFVRLAFHPCAEDVSRAGFYASITPFGEDALALFEDQAEQKTRDDAQHKADALQREQDKRDSFKHDLTIMFCTAVITRLFDHFDQIVDLIKVTLGWAAGK